MPENLGKQPCLSSRKKPAAVYLLLFLVCLLTVFRVIPDWLCLVLTAVLVFFCDKKLFAQADYCLLGTFVCFFSCLWAISHGSMPSGRSLPA